MPVVIFFACLDLEQKSSFMDGHYIKLLTNIFDKEYGFFQSGKETKMAAYRHKILNIEVNCRWWWQIHCNGFAPGT
jgi:hypothetical protein